MQHRLLDMQTAAADRDCPGTVERLRADHDPRGRIAAVPEDVIVARDARPVHRITVLVHAPSRLLPRPAAATVGGAVARSSTILAERDPSR